MVNLVAKRPKSTAFGRRLRELREAAGLSQHALGEKAGIAYQTIAKYERGENIPNWETVEKLADALGAKMDDFRADPPASGGDAAGKAPRPPRPRGK